ncbi:MAG TPA: acyl-CoA dehydrogenase family protein [Candidatus Acidoferrales bacterium]|jgi:alkylation response protein AidB-like acyl-CoA dehydrogenase|nr:acyl-CoA dehydrogenase family protein [Candidatus Acidoferrales bacterium]
MATTTIPQSATRGGGFLITACRPEDVFTPADVNDDQRLIGQTAEEFVAKEVLPLVAELEQHKTGVMPGLLKKAGELGLLGGGIPEEYGGTGLDKVSATVLSEKLSAYASFAVSHGGHAGIGTVPIVYFGTEEQKKKYLPKIATGELISCYCLSEPQAGSDALAARTRAVLSADGKEWILNGQKMWITNGGFADVFVVFAKVDGEQFSCFLVERGYPGFSVGAEEKKMGIKGSSTVPIFFENCRVPKENLLHEIGRGHIVAFNTLNAGRFALGAYCLGGSKKVIEAASKYAKERTAFGKTLASFGLIQAKLGEMTIRTFAVESMIYRSAGMIAAAVETPAAGVSKTQQAMHVLEEYAIESSISKVAGSESVDYVVDEAVQIFGGYGFHEDYPVARAYRDSRVNRIFEGTNEINRMLIVQMLMKRALGGVLPLIPAAMKLSEEVLAGPSGEEAPGGAFAEEERSVAQAKKIFLLASGAGMQRFREKLADEQEIVAALANIVMEAYAMESCLRRAQRAAGRGGAAAGVMADAARAYIYDASERVEREARTALAAILEGDALRTQLAVLRRFAKREPVNTISLRRNVAAAVLAQDRYPFEGR